MSQNPATTPHNDIKFKAGDYKAVLKSIDYQDLWLYKMYSNIMVYIWKKKTFMYILLSVISTVC